MPRGGMMAKRKGYETERKLVNLMKSHKIKAKRIPMSGAHAHQGITEGHDVDIWPRGRIAPLVTEVKARNTFPDWLMKLIGENEVVALKANNRPFMFVLSEETLIDLLTRRGEQWGQFTSSEKTNQSNSS